MGSLWRECFACFDFLKQTKLSKNLHNIAFLDPYFYIIFYCYLYFCVVTNSVKDDLKFSSRGRNDVGDDEDEDDNDDEEEEEDDDSDGFSGYDIDYEKEETCTRRHIVKPSDSKNLEVSTCFLLFLFWLCFIFILLTLFVFSNRKVSLV